MSWASPQPFSEESEDRPSPPRSARSPLHAQCQFCPGLLKGARGTSPAVPLRGGEGHGCPHGHGHSPISGSNGSFWPHVIISDWDNMSLPLLFRFGDLCLSRLSVWGTFDALATQQNAPERRASSDCQQVPKRSNARCDMP